MASRKFRRRQLIQLTVGATLGWCLLEPWILEPYWVRIRRLRIGATPSHRIVQISDIHYKGNRDYLRKVVEQVNALSPDFICFTGDLVEQAGYVTETLEVMSSLKYPVYSIPGNHDYWSGASFAAIAQFCRSTGGAWLTNQATLSQDQQVQIVGATGSQPQLPLLNPELKRLLLVHYPLFVDRVNDSFDLISEGQFPAALRRKIQQ